MENKLHFRYGVELTWILAKKKDHRDSLIDAIAAYLNEIMYIKYRKKFNLYEIEIDGGSVESPTPPFTSFSELRKFYNIISKETQEFGLVPYSRDNFLQGGQGHIHFSMNRWTHKFLRNLFCDYANRPYLQWIFNCPYDYINATSFFTELDFCDNPEFLTLDYSLQTVLGLNNVCNNFIGGKSKGLYYNRKTVECRFFDNPRNWEDLVDHLKFLDAYLLYIKRQPGLIPITIEHGREIKNMSLYFCKKEFKLLLNELGLDYKNYKRFVNRNMAFRLNNNLPRS